MREGLGDKEQLMLKRAKVSAPGKIILSGEHTVVYGHPAILAAVDRRLSVEIEKAKSGLEIISREPTGLVNYALRKTKEAFGEKLEKGLRIKIDSQIPVGCGMGSSAALAVAFTGAIFRFVNHSWSQEKINEIAYEIEKKQHGNPSGGDNSISTYGGFLWFRKETEKFKVFSHLVIKFPPKIFLIDGGKPEETTGEMVAMVKDLYLTYPRKIQRIFREIEVVTKEILNLLLEETHSRLRELFLVNEKLLEKLGVVSPKNQSLIRKIEKIGGGAKISGAGGKRKDSGIILAYHKDPEVLLRFAQKEKLPLFEAKLGEEGVRVEKESL